ncbi:hypothetical protein FSARC_10450 [Fusarium sarcochroum]|uniref:Uncharacterized protein n=1 Tax=Fusarium sarcochroum TaxID=1208366 RepID=A0A8H4TM47_9HYPO|nr:hypothetical protein FSARC_10450 [Fusarium sarcochroum]
MQVRFNNAAQRRDGLQSKSKDSKIGPFISDQNNVSETKQKEGSAEDKPTETPTKSNDATATTNNPSATETNAEPTRIPEEPQLNAKSGSHPAYAVPQQPIDGESALDDLLAEDPARNRSRTIAYASSFELPVLDEDNIHLSRKQFRHSLMHDESLGVSTLGAPADAIIINNPNKVRRERKAPVVIEAQPVKAPPDLDWEQMAPVKDDAELEAQEINDNINELRPDTRILRVSEIQKVVDALCGGFTINQLRDYHRNFKVEVVEPDFLDYPWIKQRNPWRPINGLRVRGTDKTAFAQKIVFDVWKVEIQETLDDLGRASVWLDPEIFIFLTYGHNNTGRLLHELRRDFLVGEVEKIDLTHSLSRISIMARKSTTYGILAHIDQAVQRMQTRFIEVKSYLPPYPRYESPSYATLLSKELAELGRLTKTSIQLIKEGKADKLKVSWIPKIPKPEENSTDASETENLADIVFRLLVGRPTPAFDNSLQCIPLQEGTDACFIEPQRQNRTMSWRDKLQKWQRAVAPISKSSEYSSPHINLAKSAKLPEWEMPPSGNKDATIATFGHILHRVTDPSIESLSRGRRILSPLTPHPASFSALKPDDDKPLKQSTTIILNLAPRETHAESLDNLRTTKTRPPVCVKLPVNSDADLENFSIPEDATAECLVPLHITDVLLPHESVDVRLKHERSLSLDINQPGLKKFLETSQFNLLQGHLQTPSQATLSIPRAWLYGNRGNCDKTGRNVEVLYDFRGLEIHQNIEMPWRNHTLRYSSIEAGQHGGQRQEITLQAGTPENDQFAFSGEAKETFLQLVEDMATGKCFSWSEGYKAIKHRQLEDYSYNLPEEELTEDIIVDNDKFDEHGRLKPKRYEQDEESFDDEYVPRRYSKEESQSDKQDDTLPVKRDIFDDIDEVLNREPDVEDPPTGTKDGSLDYQSFFDGIFASPKAIKDESDNSPSSVDAVNEDESPTYNDTISDVKPTNEETTSDVKPDKDDEVVHTTHTLPAFPNLPKPVEKKPRKTRTPSQIPTEVRGKDESIDAHARNKILKELKPTPQPELTTPDKPKRPLSLYQEMLQRRREAKEARKPKKPMTRRVDLDEDPLAPRSKKPSKKPSKKSSKKSSEKPKKPEAELPQDPFASKFTARATDKPSTVSGFFDELPEPAKRRRATKPGKKR